MTQHALRSPKRTSVSASLPSVVARITVYRSLSSSGSTTCVSGSREKLIFFTILVLILLVIAAFARKLCPYDPDMQDLLLAQKPPSAEHILGTDRYGRDMLSRVLVGSTTSIYATLLLVALITVVGTAIGIICGWCGGILDTVLMRVSDLFLAFPSLVFALAVAGVLGGGIQNAIIALAVIGWPKFARLARGLTLAQKDSP